MEKPFINQNNEGTNNTNSEINSIIGEQENQGYNQQLQYQISPPQMNIQTLYINPFQKQPL